MSFGEVSFMVCFCILIVCFILFWVRCKCVNVLRCVLFFGEILFVCFVVFVVILIRLLGILFFVFIICIMSCVNKFKVFGLFWKVLVVMLRLVIVVLFWLRIWVCKIVNLICIFNIENCFFICLLFVFFKSLVIIVCVFLFLFWWSKLESFVIVSFIFWRIINLLWNVLWFYDFLMICFKGLLIVIGWLIYLISLFFLIRNVVGMLFCFVVFIYVLWFEWLGFVVR